MSEVEWVGLEDVPSVADERAMNEHEFGTNGNGPETEEDSWTPVDLSEVPDEPPVPPILGGLGLAYPGKRHVFSGPQESAKTLCAYVIGLEVLRADGGFCLIDFEMGRWDARNRLRELGATSDELRRILYFEPEDKMTADVMERIIAAKPDLVVIDAAAGAFDLEELDDNKRADMERFARIWLQPFRRAKIATIALDHVTKNVEGRGKYAIGSERKVGGADVHLGFEVVHPIKRGGHGLYKVVTHKDRGGFLKRGKLAEFELTSDPDTHLIRWEFKVPVEGDEEHPFRPTNLMEKVSRYVEMQQEPVTIGDIKSMVTGKAEYVIEAVNLLVEEGHLEETVGARKARLFESVSAYREASDRPVPHPFPPVPEKAHSTRSPFPVSRRERVGDELGDGNGSEKGNESDDDGIPF